MSGYWEFYEETARAISFAGSSRVSHKFTGVKQIATRDEEPNERWIESAEDAVWPLIYRWHYLRDRRNVPEQRGWFTMRQREHPEFVAQLSEANQSRGVLDAGWRVVSRGPDECLCEKGGIPLRISTASLQTEGMRPNDETVTVRFPCERRYWMPLYYCTAGGIAAEVTLRLYFNVKSACAPWLLRILSHEFQQAGASYELKLLNHPQRYTRPDSAVLYVPASSVDLSRAIIDQLIAMGNSAFRGAVPALTRRIFPGIALADEPPPLRGRRVSFGEHRCRILARGLARSHAEGGHSVTEAVETIRREFVLRDLDPAQPYMAAGGQSAVATFCHL